MVNGVRLVRPPEGRIVRTSAVGGCPVRIVGHREESRVRFRLPRPVSSEREGGREGKLDCSALETCEGESMCASVEQRPRAKHSPATSDRSKDHRRCIRHSGHWKRERELTRSLFLKLLSPSPTQPTTRKILPLKNSLPHTSEAPNLTPYSPSARRSTDQSRNSLCKK